MSKIILFSDVHGNLAGLKAIFSQIKQLTDITHIVGCGDFFDIGAGTDEIFDICLENKVIMLKGNHEDVLQVIDQDKEPEKYHPESVIFKSHEWLKNWLKKDYYLLATELPIDVSIKLNKYYTLYACHASKEDMYSHTCASSAGIDILRKTYGYYEENIIVYGHHHESHVITVDDKILINCASVGARKDDNISNYTIIEYDDEKITISQKMVMFDREEYEKLKIDRNFQRDF